MDVAHGENGRTNGFSLRAFGISLDARGAVAAGAVFVVAMIAAPLYVGWRMETALVRTVDRIEAAFLSSDQASKSEHRDMARNLALTACVVAYPPEQRGPMRTASSYEAFRQFCPWLP